MKENYANIEEMLDAIEKEYQASPWWYKAKTEIGRFINRIKSIKREVKWAYQRVFRGYDDRLLWNLSSYITEFMIAGLEYMTEGCNGFPPDITEDEWDEELKIMLDGFIAARDIEDVNFDWETPDEMHEKLNALNKRFYTAMDLVKEYYFQLWD